MVLIGFGNTNLARLLSSASENRTSSSPEKEDRYYTTRASFGFNDNNAKILMDAREDKGFV
uniref:Uncharacterized protein n=1 Tax=Nelumbo nucifera TaxID=4432 RepID=A0A822Y6Y7_NELNU|nr:TPA_asm: hypothetical protein HUJ06_028839 [Nelumbo nucifera]